MSRKFETELKFSQNWGGKLDQPRYTTVRGQDKLYREGDVLPVTLATGLYHTKKSAGHVVVVRVEFKRLRDFTIQEILEDIGRRTSGEPRKYFFKLMEDFYKFKRWWDGEYTVLQKLTLDKMGREGYAS